MRSHSSRKREIMRTLFVFAIAILVLTNSPAISQVQVKELPCSKPYIKIAKENENYIAPFTSCVTPEIAERFESLGWQIVPQDSNAFETLDQESLEEIISEEKAEEFQSIGEATEEFFEEVGEIGEDIEELTEEVIEETEEAVEEIGETIEEAVEEISETIEETTEEISEAVEETTE